MSSDKHWGDTEFAFNLGVALIILALGIPFIFMASCVEKEMTTKSAAQKQEAPNK